MSPETAPKTVAALVLALFGTTLLLVFNKLVTHWTFIALSALFLVSLLVFISRTRVWPARWMNLGIPMVMLVFVFGASATIEYLTIDHVATTFTVVVCLVVVFYWLLARPSERDSKL